MIETELSCSQTDIELWVSPFLSYELWKLRIKLQKQAIQTTSYLLSTYLINYTMGMMKSATFRNELFSVWATFLIIFLGSADCISAYSLEDSENRKRYNLELFVMYFWLGWLIGMHTYERKFMIPLYLLYFLSLRRT